MNKEDEQQLEQEIEAKIQEMESKDFAFPKRFSKNDYLLVAAVAGVCLVCLIAGAFI